MTGLAETSARTAWNTLRKKILASQEDAVAGDPKTPGSGDQAKKTPAKRKSTGGKKGANGEDVEGNKTETTTETPSKKPRGRPAKPKVIEAGDDEDSEMKDTTDAPAATPAKKKATPKETKASRKSPQVGSDDTAHEGGATINVEPPKEIVKVKATNGEIEVTITEKDKVEGEDEEAIAS